MQLDSLRSKVGLETFNGKIGRMDDDMNVSQWHEAARLLVTDGRTRSNNQSRELETIRAAASLIEAFEVRGGDCDDPCTISLLVDLSRHARDRNRLVRYANQLLKLSEKGRAKAASQLVAAFMHSGNFDAARRYAVLIPESYRGPGLRKRIALLDMLREIAEQFPPAREILQFPADACLPEELVQSLGKHLAPTKAACLHAVLHGIPSPDKGTEPVAEVSVNLSNDQLQLVFCGGFKWSGASAVCDFLADFPGVARAPDAMRFFTGPDFTIQSLHNAFRARDAEALVVQMRGLTLRLLAGIVLGEKQTEKDILDHWKRSVAALEWSGTDKESDDLVKALLAFFKQLVVALRAELPVFPTQAFERFITALLRLILPGDSHVVLFDSVLRASDCALLELLPQAQMFCVRRDPRDMFVTQVMRGDGSGKVEPYVVELRSMIQAWQHGKARLGDNCTALRFEDFVRDPNCREMVRDLVIGSGIASPRDPAFKPEDSATNIGIFRNYADEQALDRLAEAFPELCGGAR